MSAQKHTFVFKSVRLLVIALLVSVLPISTAFAKAPEQSGGVFKKQLPDNGVRSKSPALATAGNFVAQSGSNLLQDPSFEAFTPNPYWSESSTNFGTPLCIIGVNCGDGGGAAGPHSGSVWAWFGGNDFSSEVSPEVGDLAQNVTFPAAKCGATLQFYFWIGAAAAGSDANDFFRVYIDENLVFTSNATQMGSYSTYTLVSIDVSSYANGAVRHLEFYSNISDQYVNFNLDDVSLVSGQCKGSVQGDYNGDGKKDIAVFRPSNSTWYIYGVGPSVYGTSGDIPVSADYNGDGKTDIAVFRPSNSTWYIYGVGPKVYGTTGDIPVVADYDGDGKADIAVFRPSNSTWYIYGVGPRVYGTTGDIPVVADYDGDGKADIAVFRPSNSTWYIYGIGPRVYGTTGDTPVVADYNGDGKADIAVFRPSNSTWYIYGIGPRVYGTTGDTPVVGDYDGDGKADIAVFRSSNSTWYIYGIGPRVYGTTGDIPV